MEDFLVCIDRVGLVMYDGVVDYCDECFVVEW